MNGAEQPIRHRAWRRFRRSRGAIVALALLVLYAAVGLSAPLLDSVLTGFTPGESDHGLVLAPPGALGLPAVHVTYDGDRTAFALLDRDGDGVLACTRRPSAGAGVPLLPLLARDWPVVHGEIVAGLERVEAGGIPLRDTLRSVTGTLDCPELAAARLRWERFYRDVFARHDRQGGPDGVLTLDEWPAQEQTSAPQLEGVGGPADFARLDADGDGRLTPLELMTATRHLRLDAERLLSDADEDGDLRIARAEFPGAPVLRPHRMGTDDQGRDVLSRLLHGARISLLVGFSAAFLALIFGLAFGVVAGYAGGLLDELMMRFVDVLYGIPLIFVVLLVVVFLEPGLLGITVLVAGVSWLTVARIARGQVVSLRNAPFVEAARAYGAPRRTIVFRHLLRNAAGPVVAYATLLVPAAIVAEAFLAFVGVGMDVGSPSWGAAIASGARHIGVFPWLVVGPALALALTLFAFHALGDGLRRALDPRLER